MVGRVHACGESGQSVVPIGPAAGVPLRATPIIGKRSNTRYRHTIASDIHSAAAPDRRGRSPENGCTIFTTTRYSRAT
ncbi:hypothetical protein L810_6043 [Burkholderia sp. AU4i]|nr:hypothetical protein L810_6043 [Burkholderia sp. AU4i]